MKVFSGSATEMRDMGLKMIRIRPDDRTVVFFDIDDTLLNTNQNFVPITPIVELYHAALSVGLRVVVITARLDTFENRGITEMELLQNHLPYALLYMRPEWYDTADKIAQFKQICRKDALERLQALPLFAIGDQPWDFGVFGGVGLWIR